MPQLVLGAEKNREWKSFTWQHSRVVAGPSWGREERADIGDAGFEKSVDTYSFMVRNTFV